eukprot:snap_masked-scaffold_4-processed-gene-11.33-mRNA-1 protein AED:1.00 eAED:1.00 QI:0/-1/0/0/-1/1/1/0/593
MSDETEERLTSQRSKTEPKFTLSDLEDDPRSERAATLLPSLSGTPRPVLNFSPESPGIENIKQGRKRMIGKFAAIKTFEKNNKSSPSGKGLRRRDVKKSEKSESIRNLLRTRSKKTSLESADVHFTPKVSVTSTVISGHTEATNKIDPNTLLSRKVSQQPAQSPSSTRRGGTLGRNKRNLADRRQSYAPAVQMMLHQADEAAKDQKKKRRKSFRKTLSHKIQAKKMESSSLARRFARGMQKLNSKRSLKRAQEEYKLVHELGFDVFGKSDIELVETFVKMCDQFRFNSVYVGDEDQLWNLTVGIKDNYNNNPFHNWYHGFTVAHVVGIFFMRNPWLLKCLRKEYSLALLIAALGHDLNHPGNDNSFEVNNDSSLAQYYQYQSVLENLHVSTLLELLKDPTKNVFGGLSTQQQSHIKEFMVDAVLATDMTKHKEAIESLKKIDAEKFKGAMTGKKIKREKKEIIFHYILHASDISGQCLDVGVAIEWEERIAKEMQRQSEKMVKRNMVIPSHLDPKHFESKITRAKSQLGFIDFVLDPFWKEVGRVFPRMAPLYFNLTNVVREYYQTLVDEGEDAAIAYIEEHEHLGLFDDDFL